MQPHEIDYNLNSLSRTPHNIKLKPHTHISSHHSLSPPQPHKFTTSIPHNLLNLTVSLSPPRNQLKDATTLTSSSTQPHCQTTSVFSLHTLHLLNIIHHNLTRPHPLSQSLHHIFSLHSCNNPTPTPQPHDYTAFNPSTPHPGLITPQQSFPSTTPITFPTSTQ